MNQIQDKKQSAYSVSKGAEYIDWYEVIEKKKNGKLSHHEHQFFYGAACQWVTYACGNMCSIIPRDETGSPRDYILRELGGKFPTAFANDPDRALDILNKIEERSKYLIEQEVRKNIVKKGREWDNF